MHLQDVTVCRRHLSPQEHTVGRLGSAVHSAGVAFAVAGRELVWPCSSEVSVCRKRMRLLVPMPTGGMGGKLTS